MKKFLYLVVFLLFVFFIQPKTFAETPIKIIIDGNLIDSDVAPVIKDSRTFVPLRLISENLNISIEWNSNTQQITLLNLKDSKNAVFNVGSKTYILGNDVFYLDVPPQIIDGRTFLPIKVIGKLFGKEVSWNGDSRTVIIQDKFLMNKYINSNIYNTRDNNFIEATVLKVIDGDTFEANINGINEKVRLILVNTPETKHPEKDVEFFGQEAYNFTKTQLEGKTVYLEKDISSRDKYGRLLYYVWITRPSSNNPTNLEISNYCFNSILVENGYAQVSTYPPDLKYLTQFKEKEKIAIDNKIGLWAYQTLNSQVPKFYDNLTVSPYKDRLIKGNINSKGEKIYHCPGQRDYTKTVIDESKGERWFATEEEAIKAGWRKAMR